MQGGILAAASIISRIIGMLYRLPVTNIIGDQGNSYYSAAYEVYNIILLISSYSLPLAVSKVVSAKVALGEHKNAWRSFKAAMYMSLVVGAVASAITFFWSRLFHGNASEYTGERALPEGAGAGYLCDGGYGRAPGVFPRHGNYDAHGCFPGN